MENYINDKKMKSLQLYKALPSMTSSQLMVETVSPSCLMDAGSSTVMIWVQPLPPDSLSTPLAVCDTSPGNTFLLAACTRL